MSFGNPFRNRSEVVTPDKAVKVKTFRCALLHEVIAELPCQLCGKPGRTQACHGNMDKGSAIKTSAATMFAACVECHAGIDQGGKRPKAERRALEAELNLKTLRALIETGKLVPR